MNVLLCPVGSRGDVQPLVALGKALRDHGHTVSFCSTIDTREWLEREKFRFHPVDIDAEKLVQTLGDDLRNPFVFVRTAANLASKLIDGVGRACHGFDVVVGAGPQGAAPIFCEARHIPYVFAAYCPVAIRSDRLAPYAVSVQTLPRWINRICWNVQAAFFNLAMRRSVNEARVSLGLRPIRHAYDAFTRPGRTICAFDPAFAPGSPDRGDSVTTTGFWFLDDRTPLDADLESFFAEGPPPVYIGFGSMSSSDPAAQSRMVIAGVKESGSRAVISSGWAGLGRGIEIPPGCRLIGPVSHAVLFPRLSAVVHHGGAGTTAAAGRAGVPQIVVPHLLDQHYWGHRVAVLGLGPRPIPVRKLRASRLAAAIRAATSDEGMRSRASAMGAMLRVSDGLGEAVRQIERHAAAQALR